MLQTPSIVMVHMVVVATQTCSHLDSIQYYGTFAVPPDMSMEDLKKGSTDTLHVQA